MLFYEDLYILNKMVNILRLFLLYLHLT